ncbi:MAG TPA: hypothetical protein VLJ37_09185 [bacterium]|nr:hypothetical protein [bacterium]
MKKAFASIALLLLLAGCLPFAPSAGVKGGTDRGTDGEDSLAGRPEDSVVTGDTAGPEAGTIQAGPIAPEVANRIAFAEQGPIEPKSEMGEADPLIRFAPPPPPANSGPLAFEKAGPIDPKSEIAEALPRYCLFDRLQYGPDLSSVIRCDFIPPPLTLPGGGEALDLKLLLERNQTETRIASDQWGPQSDGVQVRLIYQPLDQEGWETAQFIDTTTDASPGDGNVSFSGLPVGPGLIRFFLLKKEDPSSRSPDFQTEALKSFPDKESYQAWPLGGDGFIFIGYLQLAPPQTVFLAPAPTPISRLTWSRRLLAVPEPESRPIDRRLRMLKDTDLSEP